MRAVVRAAVFFGMNDEDTVNEDAAMRELESIACMLRELGDEEQREFRLFVKRLSVEESQAGNSEVAAYLSTLCENLGLES
jgi:hypothetical protein